MKIDPIEGEFTVAPKTLVFTLNLFAHLKGSNPKQTTALQVSDIKFDKANSKWIFKAAYTSMGPGTYEVTAVLFIIRDDGTIQGKKLDVSSDPAKDKTDHVVVTTK